MIKREKLLENLKHNQEQATQHFQMAYQYQGAALAIQQLLIDAPQEKPPEPLAEEVPPES